MSEKEKEILKTMAEALPEMSDMKKGEFLGYAKAMVVTSDRRTDQGDGEEVVKG